MTWSKTVTLWCDDPDCSDWIKPGAKATVEAAEKEARKVGWSGSNDEHYCPQHSGGSDG